MNIVEELELEGLLEDAYVEQCETETEPAEVYRPDNPYEFDLQGHVGHQFRGFRYKRGCAWCEMGDSSISSRRDEDRTFFAAAQASGRRHIEFGARV